MRKIIILFLFSILFISSSQAASLELNGGSQTLDGNYSYDYVNITNGGILYISAYNGTGTTGTLNLTLLYDINIDSTSQINGSKRGYRGGNWTTLPLKGEGTGGGDNGSDCGLGGADRGAGGGGYGGNGGKGGETTNCGGSPAAGGGTYGTINGTDISMGSGAGAGGEGGNGGGNNNGNNGENGGGMLIIDAKNINVFGTISLNGGNGGNGGGGTWTGGGGGGASGGGLKLSGNIINITGSSISVNGGYGGGSGGTSSENGGGGRVKIFYIHQFINTSSVITTTGKNNGTIYYNQTVNSIPSTPQISFPLNNSRHYNNSINFTWNTSTDADGDSITYDFWLSSQPDFSNTVNRTNFTNNWTGNIATTDGVTNYGRVRSYDSYEYSNWSNVIQFTENTAPSVVNITLSPSSPSGQSNLTISMNGSDAEGDSLIKYYRWYKNGVLNNSWNDSTYLNYTNNFTTGDSIYVYGFVWDGYENSSEVQSNSVVIGSSNSAPILPGISLNPSTKKYNKIITISTSSNITDTESTLVRLQVYRYVSGAKSYFGNSSWVTPPNNASVEITIPWSDGIAHTIYAQAQDNGNATQDNTTNLTSTEVSATFTSDITSPTVNSSSVSPSSVTTGSSVTITITADGKGANISSANVTITRPDYTSVTLDLTCTYTSGDNSTCTRSYTANSGAGTYSIDSFGLADDSNNTAMPSSALTFEATAASSGSTGGGGGGGGTTIIYKDKEEDNATAAIPLLRLKNITSGATEPQLQEIADCLTQSLFMENKCSGYNYGVVVETMNWWVFMGAFFASFGVVIVQGIYQDKKREWYTEPLLYGTTTTLILIILVAVGFNMYLLNYLAGSPKYAWTFASTALWGGIVALVWDNYYYGKKKYTILRSA